MTLVMALAPERQTDDARSASSVANYRFPVGTRLARPVHKGPVMRTNTAPVLTNELYDQICERPAANDNQRRGPKPNSTAQEDVQLVRQLAGAMARRLPSHVELDELISLGNLGLVEARRRWDASRGVPFAAFAAPRIRGAMIDGLRQEDPVSRGERARLQKDIDAEASVQLVDIDSAADLAVDGEELPLERLEKREQLARMRQALSCLRDRERHVIERHFFGECSLREIGEELGVTESRACQIVGAALGRMRAHLKEAA